MSLFTDPNETEPRIEIDRLYKFGISLDRKTITVYRTGGGSKPYRISELRQYAAEDYRPLAVRDLARAALAEFDLLPPREEDPVSDTIVTILKIKVYQELTGLRRFFIRRAGKKVFGGLTELEEKIKKGG